MNWRHGAGVTCEAGVDHEIARRSLDDAGAAVKQVPLAEDDLVAGSVAARGWGDDRVGGQSGSTRSTSRMRSAPLHLDSDAVADDRT